MDNQTIEVTGYFGKPVQKTREQYVSIWRGQATDLYKLCPSAAHYEVKAIVEQVTAWANDEFDRLQTAQKGA